MKTMTRSAFELIEQAEVLVVNKIVIYKWSYDAHDEDEDSPIFECMAGDDEGYIYEFGVMKPAMADAVVEGNLITVVDTTGEKIEIVCYKLTPV